MRKRHGLLAALALCLLLSACGDADALQRENDALRRKLDSLTAENAALTAENAALTEENAALSEENQALAETGEENPIDTFYEAKDSWETTMEMNSIAAQWAKAWEAEARNAAQWLKGQLPLEEDRDIVDGYLAGTEEQIRRMDVMAVFGCADLNLPFEERMRSSGSIRSVLWSGAYQRLWRDTFYQLLSVAPEAGLTGESGYQFAFDAQAAYAALDELKL